MLYQTSVLRLAWSWYGIRTIFVCTLLTIFVCILHDKMTLCTWLNWSHHVILKSTAWSGRRPGPRHLWWRLWPVDLQCWQYNFFLLYSKWLVQMARDLRNSHWTALHIFKFAWLYRCRGLQVWPRHSWCVVCVCDAICNADIWGGRQIWQRLMPRALLPQEHFEPLPIFLKTLDFAAYFECVNSNA